MKFWADENFNGTILRRLLAEHPELDIVRVQDTALSGVDDVTLLAEAAEQNVIILTHDKQTLINFAYERVKAGLFMAGVIEVALHAPASDVVRDLVLLIGASFPTDFENQVRYIPLS